MLKGIRGTKQNVNHSLDDEVVSCVSRIGGLEGWRVGGLEGWRDIYHRFITLPLMFPQFWHCTVMCSAPLRLDVKAGS